MRKCYDCGESIPPGTDHYWIEGKEYCTDCIEVQPYNAYAYLLNGEYIGNSEGDGDIEFIEDWQDNYEEEEEK
ncbi:hypothetical protein 015DV002_224 [Bacillus phage 015DV002]|nr:hypothetical protein 000TH008_236 [Bacillus phage 000TH008]QQO40929.1 hypothetical protein 000TH009_236 [Bacillus phage 000TH009]QQO41178.1 hypothetical protein 015DV002_224 [Bacillus phage 015DV002]QQO41454.1 hypothetical protein 015DV004_239 [Bacillus phage 015DV004]